LRGGALKKSIEQHIKDGTYRADRHGIIDEQDSEILGKMKSALYKKFKQLDKHLNDTELNSINNNEINYYLNIIKTYNSITKNPTRKEDSNEKQSKPEL
jgi:hypothetical protein